MRRKASRDIAAYAGYDDDGKPLYLGNCCVEKVKELASHIYWRWEADKRVDTNEKLWRYVDFAKFLQMLETRSLFFPRADKFEDTFEGTSGIAERQPEWDRHYLEFFKNAVRFTLDNAPSPPDKAIEREANRLLYDIKKGNRSRTSDHICELLAFQYWRVRGSLEVILS